MWALSYAACVQIRRIFEEGQPGTARGLQLPIPFDLIISILKIFLNKRNALISLNIKISFVLNFSFKMS